MSKSIAPAQYLSSRGTINCSRLAPRCRDSHTSLGESPKFPWLRWTSPPACQIQASGPPGSFHSLGSASQLLFRSSFAIGTLSELLSSYGEPGFPPAWVSSLFNYNFNQYVTGQAIAYPASIPQSHHAACSYPGRNFHLKSFPPSL